MTWLTARPVSGLGHGPHTGCHARAPQRDKERAIRGLSTPLDDPAQ